MEFKYIDIHGHMNFAAYDPDRAEAIKRAEEASIAMITVGTQMETSRAAVELAKTHENMYAAIGLHPIHTDRSHHDVLELGEGGREFTSRGEVANLNAYESLAADPKVVAIGECGLDYYRLDEASQAKQRQAFETMIDLANGVEKPLMLHIRNGSNRSAYNDAFEILKSRAKVKGDLHFFAGSIDEAKPFLDFGFSFSFTGVVTFTHDYDEVIRYLPAERIMSETDCPFVSPAPFRGRRNEPAHVVEVVKSLAKIKEVLEEDMRLQIIENARKFFGFSWFL